MGQGCQIKKYPICTFSYFKMFVLSANNLTWHLEAWIMETDITTPYFYGSAGYFDSPLSTTGKKT